MKVKDILDKDLKVGDVIMSFGSKVVIDEDDLKAIKNALQAFDILHANPSMDEKTFEEVYTRAVR